MMKSKRISILACSLAVTVLLSGCTTFDSFREAFSRDGSSDNETVRIGILEPETGDDKEFGKLEIQGIELANEIADKVLDKKIELIYADTQSSIYSVESAVQDLISKEPAVILGSYGDAVALVASRQLRKVRLPVIGITTANPLITGGNDYYFTVAFSEASQGRALAHFAFDRMKTNSVGIIKINDEDATSEMTTEFTRTLSKLTKKRRCIEVEARIDPAEKNYTKSLQKIKDSGVKIVFVPVSLKIAESVFEAADKLNMQDVLFVGTKDWHTDKLLVMKEKYPTLKIVVVSDVLSDKKGISAGETTKQYDEFAKAYRDKYGTQAPPEETALAFDAYMLAVEAIKSAGTTDSKKLREALAHTTNYQGVSGEISFNERGEPSKPINFDYVDGKNFRSIYTVNQEDIKEIQDDEGDK